jgi:MFS family permease
MGQYHGNIYKLYIIKVAKWFMLTMPILMLFYQNMGFTAEESFQLKAFYSIAIVLFEIPSGYAADVLGRRKTIIIGSILGTLGFGIYSFFSGFYAFLAAEVILGIGQSFVSGADSALLYDSLKADGNEDQYLKLEGRNFSVGNFSEAIAGFAGGALAEISLRTPFFFQTGIAFIAIPAAFLLKEPTRFTRNVKAGWKDIWNIVKYAILKNKSLRYNILYSAIIGSATLTMAWIYPVYLSQLNFKEIEIGFSSTVLNLAVGFTTLFAYKIERRLQPKFTILTFTLVITIMFIALGFINSAWAILLLLVFYINRGVATPVLKDYINRITSSDMRATVLSLRALFIRMNFAILAPLFGYLTDTYTLNQAFIIIGIVFMVLTGSTIFLFLRSLKNVTPGIQN